MWQRHLNNIWKSWTWPTWPLRLRRDIDFSDPKTVKALEALSGEGIKPFKIKIPGVNLFKCNPDGGGGMNIGDCRTKNECPNTNCPCEPKPEDPTTPQGLVKKTVAKKRWMPEYPFRMLMIYTVWTCFRHSMIVTCTLFYVQPSGAIFVVDIATRISRSAGWTGKLLPD